MEVYSGEQWLEGYQRPYGQECQHIEIDLHQVLVTEMQQYLLGLNRVSRYTSLDSELKDSINFPHLPSLRDKALLSFLYSISSSSDHLIKEASALLNDSDYAKRQSIPKHLCPLLKAAKDSVNSLQPMPCAMETKALKSSSKKLIIASHVSKWNSQLDHLQVQSKFRDIVALESDCPT